MLIVCPSCSTSYEVKTEAIGEAGRTVRCTRCRKEWFETAPPLQAMDVKTSAEFASPSSTVMTAVDDVLPSSASAAASTGSPPAEAPSDDRVDWDMPAPDQPAPVAISKNRADEDTSAPGDMPQTPSPPLAPDSTTIEADPLPSPARIETLATPRGRPAPLRPLDRAKLPLAPTLIAIQLAVIGAGLLWRHEIVRMMPQTASFFRTIGLGVNVRGLVFADVRISRDAQDDIAVLIVEGAIVNPTHAALSVPRLRFALRNAASAELISWTAPPEKGTLGPGEELPFRSRLVSPPPAGTDILVRFLSRQDLTSGVR